MLCFIADIAKVTSEEEHKWEELYDCRDEIQRALSTVQKLELELEACDEVLLSEELNVLLRRRDEMDCEINDIKQKISECEKDYEAKTVLTEDYKSQLEALTHEAENIESEITAYEQETKKLHQRVDEKKRFDFSLNINFCLLKLFTRN